MKNFSLDVIPEASYFSKPVYLDSQFVIAAPEMPFTNDLKRLLSTWGFSEVLSDGEPREHYVPDEEQQQQQSGHRRTREDDTEKIEQAERFCMSFEKYVQALFALLPIRNELNFSEIAEKVKGFCDVIRTERRFIMRTQWMNTPSQDENHLVSHSVRSTIIAIIIGANLKFQNHRLIELGVATLLHEIGMIKLPPHIYLGKSVLSEEGKKLMYAHPILGYNILKDFDFPLVVCLAALEHHERENGSGYPKKKTSEKISTYAKIIAVACSYEAILANRSYKDAKDSHEGILELMKNAGKHYDDNVVRALVYSLSVYPIGLYVMLSNGKRGQVVDVNPRTPYFPIVQVFGDILPDGSNRTVTTSSDELHITRPLTNAEKDDI